jgi:hypothetical protein
MNNLPDGCTAQMVDDHMSSPWDTHPKQMGELAQVHGVYTYVMASIVAACKQHHVMLSPQAFQVALDGLADALLDEADHPLGILREAGWDESHLPENHKQLASSAYNQIVEHFRPKPVDCSPLWEAMRP